MNAPVTPGVGDNSGALITVDQLARDFAHVEEFVADQEAAAAKVPPVVEDDDDQSDVNKMVVKLRAAAKRCDDLRETTKRPYLDAGNTVQAFFKAFEARLLKLKTDLEARGTRYLRKKVDEERARQVAIEQQQREEAAKREREAIAAAQANKPAEAKAAMIAATEASNRAEDAAATAAAKPADLARTHTVGGTSTLTESYEPRIADYSKVDLKPLQPFIREDEIMAAAKAYARRHKDEIKAGQCLVPGVSFVPVHKGQFR